jgi:hypothetical protein
MPVSEEGVAAVAPSVQVHHDRERRDCAIEAVRPPMLDKGGPGRGT